MTKFSLCFSLVLLSCSFAISSALGQDVAGESPPLLSLEVNRTEVPLELGLSVRDAEAEFLIDLNPLAVAEAPEGFSLDLYKDVRLEARRFKTRVYEDRTSWSGHLYFPDLLGKDAPAGYILLVNHGDHVSGILNIYATQDDFQIRGNSKGEHRLIKVKHHRTPPCGMNTDEVVSVPQRQPRAKSTVTSGIKMATLLDEAEIEVLVIVPTDEHDTPFDDFIDASVDIANDAFYLSGIDASYNVTIVDSDDVPEWGTEWNYIDMYNDHDWLKWMNSGEVDDERDAAEADMVVLYVPQWNDDNCGIANIRFYHDQNYDEEVITQTAHLSWSSRAFSVQLIGCGLNDLTFAHELGHNFSLRHDTDPLSSPTKPLLSYPDPQGHIFSTAYGSRASVMGCVTDTACARLLYFSDPDFTVPMYGITPTGRVDHNNGYYADAVQVLEGLVSEYADLWEDLP